MIYDKHPTKKKQSSCLNPSVHSKQYNVLRMSYKEVRILKEGCGPLGAAVPLRGPRHDCERHRKSAINTNDKYLRQK